MNYIKNGKECCLCLTRQKFIILTPEERIRQSYISELMEKYQVPKSMIESEVPMSAFGKGLQGRADIIVYEYDEIADEKFPLILIECKEPNVALTDNVYQQAYNYNNILGAKLVIITNGIETVALAWDDNGNYYDIDKIPSYYEIISQPKFDPKVFDFIWTRPNHLLKDINIHTDLIESGIIGEDSSLELHSFFTNLYGLLLDDKNELTNLTFESYKFISDGGTRFTTFGNSAGGGFAGDYRYFIIEDENKENQIISLSIMGKLSAKNHPRWGNSIGYTLFLVAIDDFENSHLSLELALDRFIKKDKDQYNLYHDGTLTLGNKGRVKNLDVINFIKNHRPSLIKEEKVYLGTLDNSYSFTWEREDVKIFITNVINYAIVRDEFRKSIRGSL